MEGNLMKKKVLILLVVAVLAIAPAAAAQYRGSSEEGTVGIGLNLGTNTGLGLKFGMGDFDIFANIGLNFLGMEFDPFQFNLGGDVGIAYEVYDADFGGGHHMPVTVGLWFPMGFGFGEQFAFSLATLVHAGIEYQIPDVPVLFYLRLGLGLGMDIAPKFKLGFGFAGALGVMYVF